MHFSGSCTACTAPGGCQDYHYSRLGINLQPNGEGWRVDCEGCSGLPMLLPGELLPPLLPGGFI